MPVFESVTVQDGQSESSSINTVGKLIVGIQIPSLSNSDAIAFLADHLTDTFLPMRYGFDGTTLDQAYNSGLAGARVAALEPAWFLSARRLKVVLMNAGSPSTETGSRIFNFIWRPFRQ